MSVPLRRAVQLALLLLVGCYHAVPHLGRDIAWTAVVHLAATGAWFALCVDVLRGRWSPSFGEAFALALLLRAIAVPLGPELSDDVWRYLWEGQLVLDGINPFLFAPTDPALESYRTEWWGLINNENHAAVYPPAMQFAMALGWLVHPSPLGQSIVFGTIDLASFVMLWHLLKALGMPSARAVLHGWCPLVVLEVAGQSHGDSLASCFMVAGMLAYAKRHALWASIALAIGTAGKYLPAVLMPWVARHDRRGWLLFGLVTVALWWTFIPLDEPWAPFTATADYTARWRGNDSAFAIIFNVALLLEQSGVLLGIPAHTFAKIPLALLAFYLLRDCWRWRLEPHRVAVVFFLFFLGFAAAVHPWYAAGFLVPLLPLVGNRWLMAFTGTSILAYHVLPVWIERGVWEESIGWKALEWAPFWVGALQVYRQIRREADAANG